MRAKSWIIAHRTVCDLARASVFALFLTGCPFAYDFDGYATGDSDAQGSGGLQSGGGTGGDSGGVAGSGGASDATIEGGAAGTGGIGGDDAAADVSQGGTSGSGGTAAGGTGGGAGSGGLGGDAGPDVSEGGTGGGGGSAAGGAGSGGGGGTAGSADSGGPFKLTVVRTGAGIGKVVSTTPTGIDCGATCSFEFPAGTDVTLAALPQGSSLFGGWTGPCSGAAVCTVKMTQAQTVYASFTAGGGGVQWWKQFGGQSPDNCNGVAIRPGGKVLLAGHFANSVSFGGPPLNSPSKTSVFVASYEPAGTYSWSTALIATVGASTALTATDSASNVFVAGTFAGDLAVGTTLKSAGNTDAFVVKLSSTGSPLWAKALGGTDSDSATALAVDASGNVVVGGTFRGTVDFGKGGVTGTGNGDAFLLKLSGSDGSTLWARSVGNAGATESVSDVDTFGNDDVLMCMDAYMDTDFGAGIVPGYGGWDAAVAKYSTADGKLTWVKRAGSADHDSCRAVAVDSNGSAVAAGGFQLSMNFGSGAVTSAGQYDAYLAKFDSTGQPAWTKAFGDANTQYVTGLDAASNGDVVLVGAFEGTVNFGGATLVDPGTGGSVFAGRFATGGAHVWSRAFAGAVWNANVAVDATTGDSVIAGGFQGILDIDGNALGANGSTDAFAVRLGP